MQALVWPFLALTLLLLGRGWYLEVTTRRRRPSAWSKRSSLVLMGSTLLAVVLWGLRFAGLLGPGPL